MTKWESLESCLTRKYLALTKGSYSTELLLDLNGPPVKKIEIHDNVREGSGHYWVVLGCLVLT